MVVVSAKQMNIARAPVRSIVLSSSRHLISICVFACRMGAGARRTPKESSKRVSKPIGNPKCSNMTSSCYLLYALGIYSQLFVIEFSNNRVQCVMVDVHANEVYLRFELKVMRSVFETRNQIRKFNSICSGRALREFIFGTNLINGTDIQLGCVKVMLSSTITRVHKLCQCLPQNY